MADTDIQKKITSFLDSALKKNLSGDYDESIRDLKAAEVLDKNNPEILYNLGINHARKGLYRTASQYFERLVNLKATYVDIITVRKLLAYSLIRLKEYARAEEQLDETIKLAPSDVSAHSMMGYTLEKKEDLKGAITAYRTILELDKKNHNACNSLAYILARLGKNLPEALRLARSAYEIAKDNAAYMDTLGYVYLRMGDYRNAALYLGKAGRRRPYCDEINQHIRELRASIPAR